MEMADLLKIGWLTYKDNYLEAFVHVISIGGSKGYNIKPLINYMEEPMLVASTDGTGTKTKIVRNPADLIYHGFNDISAQGVKPIAFSLYISGNLPHSDLEGIDRLAAILAEKENVVKLPSKLKVEYAYFPNEVDIAGTVIGLIDKKDIINGSNVIPGDKIIGIQVDGLMTNGYTLARKLCDKFVNDGIVSSLKEPMDELNGKSLEFELSRPHRPMVDILFGYDNVEGVLSKYKGQVKGMAHITGGGQPDNIPRMLPDNCKAVIHKRILEVPLLMRLFHTYGISEEELYNTFNMGIGFVLVVAKDFANAVAAKLRKYGETVYMIGTITSGSRKVILK
jgi:phosphoribosylformylglycinamidine cyclo-ligase